VLTTSYGKNLEPLR